MISIRFKFDNEKVAFDDFSLLTIIIENKETLYEYMKYVNNGCVGKEEYWSLYKDGEFQDIEELSDYISNIFNLQINTKKNINALYRVLKSNYYPLFDQELLNIKEQSKKIINEISEDFDIELNCENYIKEDDIFKIFDLHFAENDINKKESLIKYIKVINKLRGIRIFFINNLHAFFDEDDIKDVITETNYLNVRLVNLEFSNIFNKVSGEFIFLVDNDLCFIK